SAQRCRAGEFAVSQSSPAPVGPREFTKRSFAPWLESLERRLVYSVVNVDAGQVIRTVSDQVLGINLAWWDSALNTPRTQQMVHDAGLTAFRFPGGSSADTFHFNDPPSYNGRGTAASMASFIASAGGI